jgi:hypothetical protein
MRRKKVLFGVVMFVIAATLLAFLLCLQLHPHFVSRFVKWDGEASLAPMSHSQKITIRPPKKTTVLVISLDGEMSGSGEIKLDSFHNAIHLPAELFKTFVFDWRGDEVFVAEYVPGEKADGAITMRWRFRPLIAPW